MSRQIWTAFIIDDGYDVNLLVRARTAKQAMAKVQQFTGIAPEGVQKVGRKFLHEYEITDDYLAVMDRDGWVVYDSGT